MDVLIRTWVSLSIDFSGFHTMELTLHNYSMNLIVPLSPVQMDATLLAVVAFVCTPLPTRTQELPTLLAQQCWELLRFDRFQTLRNNTQQHPTTSNGVCKRTQHVRSNNVESCWPTMLRPFARGLRVTFLGKGFQLRTRRKHLWVFSSNNVCSHVDLLAP